MHWGRIAARRVRKHPHRIHPDKKNIFDKDDVVSASHHVLSFKMRTSRTCRVNAYQCENSETEGVDMAELVHKIVHVQRLVKGWAPNEMAHSQINIA